MTSFEEKMIGCLLNETAIRAKKQKATKVLCYPTEKRERMGIKAVGNIAVQKGSEHVIIDHEKSFARRVK